MESPLPFTVVDVLVVMILAAGALIGWIQGFLRYLLASVAVLVAFVLAAQLKASTTELLAFWSAFTPRIRETVVFQALFVLLVVGLWFVIRALAPSLRLRVNRLADELGGAATGIIFAAMCVVFFQLVLATHYERPAETGVATTAERGEAVLLRDTHAAFSDSGLVSFLRQSLTPTAGLLARPFVPDDVRVVL